MTLIELTLSTAIKEAGEYGDVRLSKEDAEHILKLLKDQEARVLTPEEIKSYDGYCWCEQKDKKIMYVSLIKYGLLYDICALSYDVEKLNWTYYGKGLRYWSAQPTEEQRKAVKWDE